jgi:hypothetical protein
LRLNKNPSTEVKMANKPVAFVVLLKFSPIFGNSSLLFFA